MNRRTFLTTLGTAFLTIGAGCASDTTKEDIMSELTDVTEMDSEGLSGPTATRFIDRRAGVVLYTAWSGTGGGMTAVPLSETDLE